MEQAEVLLQEAEQMAGKIYVELSSQDLSTKRMLGVAMRLLALIATRVDKNG
jgi:hypothetical protein